MCFGPRQPATNLQERRGRSEKAGRNAVERTEITACGAWRVTPNEMTLGDVELLEERLGYRFKRRELLERALTHSSAVPELKSEHENGSPDLSAVQDNERLEFLGDAVLELLAREYLLTSFPEWNEGQLSKSRAGLVNARSLEDAARRIRLGEHLRLGRGEEKTGGREKPTLLADAFEAVVRSE